VDYVFWVVTPCNLVGGYQRFGGRLCLHHQGRVTNVPSKRWQLPIRYKNCHKPDHSPHIYHRGNLRSHKNDEVK
jgi:hypothetical protein